MAGKHHHEDHSNHEAWAIPYADLMTLLLAFFVVMYAISSVNEGKYRAVSDALSSAFGGPPRKIVPIQLGQTQLRGSAFDRPSLQTAAARTGPASMTQVSNVRVLQLLDMPTFGRAPRAPDRSAVAAQRALRDHDQQLNALGDKIQQALTKLVRQKLVTVRRGGTFLEVEIQSDILFASGAAAPSALATSTVRKLATVLRASPNAIRVEGYTDDRPIRTAQFLSNWELSAARAASVVHVLADEGVGPQRLAVVGYGEHQPVANNITAAGRNANRRVLLVILAAPQGPDAVPDPRPAIALQDGRETAPTAPTGMPASPAVRSSATASPDVLAKTRATPAALARAGANPSPHPAATAPMTTTVAARLAPVPGAG